MTIETHAISVAAVAATESLRSREDRWRVTGAWLEGDEIGDRKFLHIGDLELESGEIIPEVRLAYQSWGTLNDDKSNAILVNHAGEVTSMDFPPDLRIQPFSTKFCN